SYRAFAQSEALDQPQTHSAAGMVPLDNDELEQIPLGIGDNLAVPDRRLFLQMFCSDLSRLDTNYFDQAGFSWDTQVTLADISNVYSICDARGITRQNAADQLPLLGHQPAILIDRFNLKGTQVVQHYHISNKARGYGTTIIETKILSGIIGSEPYSLDRIES